MEKIFINVGQKKKIAQLNLYKNYYCLIFTN